VVRAHYREDIPWAGWSSHGEKRKVEAGGVTRGRRTEGGGDGNRFDPKKRDVKRAGCEGMVMEGGMGEKIDELAQLTVKGERGAAQKTVERGERSGVTVAGQTSESGGVMWYKGVLRGLWPISD